MTIKINTTSSPFKISNKLLGVLENELGNNAIETDGADSLTFVFKDESYSAENGGFHPVEIRLVKLIGEWKFDYITDFCFVGSGHCGELTKEIDFDFTNDYGFHLYTGEYELRKLSELYQLWESNFLSYVEMKVYQVKITTS